METLTLSELVARIARRWRILVAGALVGLLAGLIAQHVMTARYEATAVLFVDSTTPDRVDMVAEEAVATSRRVMSEALDALGQRHLTLADLERSARASAVKDSRLLRVRFTASDPELAVRGADAVAQAYAAVRSVDASLSGTAAEAQHIGGTIVDPARTPEAPVGASPLATMFGATAAGLLLAAPVAARPTRRPEAPAS